MILSRQFRALFRFAGWWALPWGVGPAAAFAALGAIAGAPAVVHLPLLGLGLVSGALPPDRDSPRLPGS